MPDMEHPIFVIDLTFWKHVTREKLNTWKTSTEPHPLRGTLTIEANRIRLDESSFHLDETIEHPVFGLLTVLNSLADLQSVSTETVTARTAAEVWSAREAQQQESSTVVELISKTNFFHVYAYVDLKSYEVRYAVGLVIPRHCDVVASGFLREVVQKSTAQHIWIPSFPDHPDSEHQGAIVAAIPVPTGLDASWAISIEHPSPRPSSLLHANWIAELFHFMETTYSAASLFVALGPKQLVVTPPKADHTHVVVQWIRPRSPPPGPGLVPIFYFNLRNFLSPDAILKEAVELNVSLIRWRILPEFDPSLLRESRVLIYGAGTLGCAVARLLIAWGVRHITFIDSGNVGPSNPARQWLYSASDMDLARPRSKAEVACERLREIRPDAEVHAHNIDVPMLGHPRYLVSSSPDCSAPFREAFALVSQCMQSHDVSFLLTDSRESRWLPSMIYAGLAWDKRPPRVPLCITAAIGFDTFVVMRHGTSQNDLACYFCNDLFGPSDSLSGRPIDQQCTVSRPGVAAMASAVAVELMAAAVQHRLNADAPGENDGTAEDACLGLPPHAVRGSLTSFALIPTATACFERCVACSVPVRAAFRDREAEFVADAICDPTVLERLTGLDEMRHRAERLFEEMQADEDERLPSTTSASE